MINNRQAGRRRGRNNPRQNGGGGNRGNGGDSGNRIDNRARGNAAQLLEKYRNMARDAQLAGDRVNMEYYLQFADHYFRVLADNRARQEENQQRFRRFDENEQDDEFADEGDGFFPNDITRSFEQPRQYEGRQSEGRQSEEGRRDDGNGNRRDREDNRREGRDEPRRERNDRNDRNDRPDRGERTERNDRSDREEGRRDNRRPQRERQPAPQPVEAVEEQNAPAIAAPANDVVNEAPVEEAPRPRATRGRKPRQPVDAAPEPGLDASVLPPAIGRPVEAPAEEGEEKPRRTRRPRSTPAQAAE